MKKPNGKTMTELEFTFRDFNSKYFRFGKKKLDTLLDVKWADLSKDKAFGVLKSFRTLYAPAGTRKTDKYEIRISKKHRHEGRTWKMTLLHEMVHFKLAGVDKSRHSCQSHMFQKEMKRLANAGAFNGLW